MSHARIQTGDPNLIAAAKSLLESVPDSPEFTRLLDRLEPFNTARDVIQYEPDMRNRVSEIAGMELFAAVDQS